MTAITSPSITASAAVRTAVVVRTPRTAGTVARRVLSAARYLDSLFAGAAEAPSNRVNSSLELHRTIR